MLHWRNTYFLYIYLSVLYSCSKLCVVVAEHRFYKGANMNKKSLFTPGYDFRSPLQCWQHPKPWCFYMLHMSTFNLNNQYTGICRTNETELDTFTTLTNGLRHLKSSFYCVRKLLLIFNSLLYLNHRGAILEATRALKSVKSAIFTNLCVLQLNTVN